MPWSSDKQRKFLWANKPGVAKKFAEHLEHGGGIPQDPRKPKKITKKDRYGNSTTVEFAEETKPLDLNSLIQSMMDKGVPQMQGPIDGDITYGNAGAHPGGPQGPDTVPAWLTPGEFVVNAEAMSVPENAAMVEQINNHGRAMQMNEGGEIPVPISPTQALLESREGYRGEVYLDSLDKPTVGHGHLLPEEYKDQVGESPFSKEQLDAFFDEDREIAREGAKRNAKKYGVDWDSLSRREKVALTSMAFQLGETGQGKFENMWTKLAAGDKEGAALEALDSNWASQTPQRAKDVYSAFQPGLGFEEGGTVPEYFEGGGFSDWWNTSGTYKKPRGGFKSDRHYSNWRKAKDRHETSFFEALGNTLIGGIESGAGAIASGISEGNQTMMDRADRIRKANEERGDTPSWYDPKKIQKSRVSPEYKELRRKLVQKHGAGTAAAHRAIIEAYPDLASAYDYKQAGIKRNMGGPVYAYRGYDTAMQDAYDIEDPNTDLSGDWVPPVYEADEISPMEQAILDQEAMAVPPEDTGEAPEEMGDFWSGIADWAMDTSVADARNASFNEKVEAANVEAAQGNADEWHSKVAELEERSSNGQPVSSAELDTAKRNAQQADEVLSHQQSKLQDAVVENALLHSSLEEEDFETAIASTNEPGDDDDKHVLKELAESPEFEEEDDPSKPSDKGQQSTPEVIAEGEKAAQADPSMVDKAKGFFKGAFSDLFDGQELARMAIMYVGSRALGYSHGGSLNWAAKQYVKRLDAKQSTLQQNAKEFTKSGKYTPASVAEYQKSGDLSKLQPVGAVDNITGNVNTRMIGGQKVAFQEIKRGDHTLYKSPDGSVYTAAQLENATQPYEASFQKGTPEYRQRRSRATGDAAGRFEEVWKAEDTIPGGRDKPATHFTKIRPKQAADEFWGWSESMGLDPESDEALQIMTQAYRQAIQDGKTGDVKPSSLKPYLEQQYIREKSGAPELFITNPDAKPGEQTKFVRGDKMASLDRNIQTVASSLPGLQGLSPKDAKDRFYQLAVQEWGALDPDDQKQYNRSATKDESGFYVFMNKRAGQLLTQAGG